jgi:hypothetical protein
MFSMRADPLQGQVGGGWTLEIETFLGPAKWRRAARRVPFGAQKKSYRTVTPLPPHLYTPMNSGQCSKVKAY